MIPKYSHKEKGNFTDLKQGFFPVVLISTDGQSFITEISEDCIPFYTRQIIDVMKELIDDSICRVRPDLRKQ